MALELRPNQLVGDHIYHEVIGHEPSGHAGYEQPVYGRTNLYFTRRMGENLLFTTVRPDGFGRVHVSIPYATQSTFIERQLPPQGTLPGLDAPAAEAAGRYFMRKSKKRRRSKKTRRKTKRRFTLF
jgi:hypothetical protein